MHHAAQRNTARERIIDRECAKPSAMPAGPPRPFKQFDTAPTINGYEVVAADTGRPVGFERDTHQSANGVAFVLNEAAARGPRALAVALGARD